VDDEVYEWLAERAQRDACSLNDVIRRLIGLPAPEEEDE